MTDWRWHAASPAFEQGVQRDIQVACALYHGSVCQVPMSLNSVMEPAAASHARQADVLFLASREICCKGLKLEP